MLLLTVSALCIDYYTEVTHIYIHYSYVMMEFPNNIIKIKLSMTTNLSYILKLPSTEHIQARIL